MWLTVHDFFYERDVHLMVFWDAVVGPLVIPQ